MDLAKEIASYYWQPLTFLTDLEATPGYSRIWPAVLSVCDIVIVASP